MTSCRTFHLSCRLQTGQALSLQTTSARGMHKFQGLSSLAFVAFDWFVPFDTFAVSVAASVLVKEVQLTYHRTEACCIGVCLFGVTSVAFLMPFVKSKTTFITIENPKNKLHALK